jgi:RimJ/RimL family protein N-acetyltransferase
MCHMSGYRIPSRIETERLVMRRYETADAEQLASVVTANIKHLERYMEWTKHEPQTVEQRREWIADVARQFDEGEDYTLGIFLTNGRFIGGTGFHVRSDPDRLEIGYWIDQDHEGQGYVTEATAALTRVALDVAGADLVGIEHAPSNERSAAVPRRLGFEQGVALERLCTDSGESVPSVSWRATRTTLSTEPLASERKPRIFDGAGAELAWPA